MIELTNILDVKNYTVDLDAIVFDLDDTLYGEKEYVKSGYQKIAKEFPEIPNMAERLWKFFSEGKPAIDELLRRENAVSDEMKQKMLGIYRHQIPDIHLYQGVQEMLLEFRMSGFKLGIITDGRPEGQRAKIRVLGLEQMVDHIIVTDELGGSEYRKPNPLAFQKMREALRTDFEKMCYIGDNLQKDFAAPLQLGMKCIHFANQDGLY